MECSANEDYKCRAHIVHKLGVEGRYLSASGIPPLVNEISDLPSCKPNAHLLEPFQHCTNPTKDRRELASRYR